MAKFYTRKRHDNSDLFRYIDSLGTEIPMDWQYYARGNSCADDCLFCGNQHDDIEVFRYAIVSASKKLVRDTYQCRSCAKKVDDMVEANHMDDYATEIVDYYSKSAETFTDAVEKERKARIDSFNFNRTFFSDVNKFYLHLDENLDLYAVNHKGHCYFCGLPAHRDDIEIMVPCTPESQLSGGHIKACKICTTELRDEFDSKSAGKLGQKCTNCDEIYFINIDERDARERAGTLSKHYCHKCAYEKLESFVAHDGGTFFLIGQNIAPRRTAPYRYREIDCYSCDNKLQVDLTLDREMYSNNIAPGNRVRCNTCLTLRTGRANGNKIHLQYDEDTFIIVQKIGKFWVYHISRIISRKERVVFKSSPDLTKSDVICTLIAWKECERLVSNNQPELWENL